MSRKETYTALVYRRPSKEVVEGWSKKPAEPTPLLEGTMPNPPIEGPSTWAAVFRSSPGKEVIGAIAVRGAPGWDQDQACAKVGLAKVAEKLK